MKRRKRRRVERTTRRRVKGERSAEQKKRESVKEKGRQQDPGFGVGVVFGAGHVVHLPQLGEPERDRGKGKVEGNGVTVEWVMMVQDSRIRLNQQLTLRRLRLYLLRLF